VLDKVCDYWRALFAERRREPKGDFITELLQINEELQVSDDELANMMFILTYAGHDSTALGLSNTLLYLAENLDVQQRLIDDPSLVQWTVEEMLRYETPLHWFPRVVARDTELGGQCLAKGERVILLFGSANRDHEEFEDADKVVIDRRPNRHVAFGAGIHACPGSALARAEIRIAVQTLLRRMPGFRVAGPVERTEPLEGGGRHLGVRWLPVTW
jgi:cytochrome P450